MPGINNMIFEAARELPPLMLVDESKIETLQTEKLSPIAVHCRSFMLN